MESGTPLGQSSGLVDDQGIHLAQVFDGGRIPEQYASGRGIASGHHDRHGRRQTQRARTGDDQHRHRVNQPECPARFGSKQAPKHEGGERNTHHHQHEIPRDHVSHALHGGAGTLRIGD